MKDHPARILYILTMVVLFASMLQNLTNWPRFRKMQGVVAERSFPKLNFQNYRDGSFQKGAEQYLQYHFGFRPPIIRLYNQYLWDFYRKTYVSPNTLTFGKDGWLYEPWFVEDYYQSRSYTLAPDSAEVAEKFKAEAKRVYQLQHVLHDGGTELFVALLPGKDLIYPEHLPDNTQYTKEKKITARGFFGPEYDRLGVNHVDVEQWFLQMKDTADFLLFPQTGTHWSMMASLYAADSLFKYMEALKGYNMHNLIIGERYVGKADRTDYDLESLLNLIRPWKRIPLHYAKVETDTDPTAIKPKLITVGDSFWWNIVNQVPLRQMFSAWPYWYYNSSVYLDPIPPKIDDPLSVKDLDMVKELLSADFVLLSYCSVQLYDLNNNFTKQALIKCCYDPEEVDSIRNALRTNIMNTPEWMEGIKTQAKAKGQEIEQALEAHIDYLLDCNPEKYFLALADSIPTKRSRHFTEVFQKKQSKP